MNFESIKEALELMAALADAAARSRRVYENLRASAQQASELTPEESAELDKRAEEIFASQASQPSGR